MSGEVDGSGNGCGYLRGSWSFPCAGSGELVSDNGIFIRIDKYYP